MHKCLPRDATHSAVFAVMRCTSVCHVDVSNRNGQFLLSNFFIAWWPHHSSFPKGKIYLNWEFILTVKLNEWMNEWMSLCSPSPSLIETYREGAVFPSYACLYRDYPQQGRQIKKVGRGVYQKFAIFNQYFRNTDTDTEYRGISKYRCRIPNRHEKIPTKIPNTDTDSKYRYRPSSSVQWKILWMTWFWAIKVH